VQNVTVDPASHRRYLERLIDTLRNDDRVIGLVGTGSTSLGGGRDPDDWSDHDLWLVVADGAEEDFRTDPSWLPDSGRIVLWMRETRHGMKGVYDDGHFVEPAVFRADELEVTRVNDCEVLLGPPWLEGRMEQIRAATVAGTARRDRGFLAGQFVTNLLVGVGRYARGERLSGHDFVKVQGAGHLLELAAGVLEPAEPGVVDDLTAWRRVERAFPLLAAEVDDALLLAVPRAAEALLDAAERHVAPAVPEWPAAAASVVRARIVAAGATE